MDVNRRLHRLRDVLFLLYWIESVEFRVRVEEGSIWERFNQNLANVGRGREEIRGTRDSQLGSAPGNFSPRHAVSTRLYIAVPTSPSRNNSGNTPWQPRISLLPSTRVEHTCVYTRTRGVDLLRVAENEMAKKRKGKRRGSTQEG